MSFYIYLNTVLILILFSLFYHYAISSILLRNKKFKCIHCGKCCKLAVRLTEKDISRIKTKLNYVVNILGTKWIKRVNGQCIFLKYENNKSYCSIYKMRPDVCRNFPKTKRLGITCNDSRCLAFRK